jgi:hypothetical protein
MPRRYLYDFTADGIHLIGVSLTGIYLMDMHLSGIHLIGMYFISIHVSYRRESRYNSPLKTRFGGVLSFLGPHTP